MGVGVGVREEEGETAAPLPLAPLDEPVDEAVVPEEAAEVVAVLDAVLEGFGTVWMLNVVGTAVDETAVAV